MRLMVMAPIDNSLYARLICASLLKEDEVQICGIIVRSHWNITRFRNEFRRDGSRLIKKVVDKYLLGDRRYLNDPDDNLSLIADSVKLKYRSLSELAKEQRIPYLKVINLNEEKSIGFMEDIEPQLILFTGGGILRKKVLEIPEIGVINCHSGILPFFRGMDVVEWTAAEDRITSIGFGVSLHIMDSGVDTGPILATKKIDLFEGDTFEKIRKRLEVTMVALMLAGVKGLRDGLISPQIQDKRAGKQYYVIHPRIKLYADDKLKNHIISSKSKSNN